MSTDSSAVPSGVRSPARLAAMRPLIQRGVAYAISIAMGLLMTACGDTPPSTRVVETLELRLDDMHWMVHDPQGKTLINPNKLAVAGELVVVTDPAGRAVHAYDIASGEPRWSYAKAGKGPRELWRPGMPAWHPSGVVIADHGTARVHVLDPKGNHLSETPVPFRQFVTAVCSRPNGDILVSVAAMDEGTAFTIPADGSTTRTLGAFFSLEPGAMVGNPSDLTDLGGSSENCVAARKVEKGMAIVGDSTVVHRGEFIEALQQRPIKPMEEMADTADLPIPFSLRTGFDGTNLFVWFGGISCPNRCIDLYDPETLAYRRSLRFEGSTGIRVHDLYLTATSLVVLGVYQDAPVIASFPRRDL